ncbi:MAG: class I SAM-dependent methyltransferase [Thermoguttaceae bacterium]
MSVKSAVSPPIVTDRERYERRLFEELADVYCRKDRLPASRWARKHRLEQTMRLAALSPDSEILEVGCGAGAAAQYLRGRFAFYWGIDRCQRLVERASCHGADAGSIRFSAANIEDFDPQRSFDIVLFVGVLHHIENWEAVLRCAARLLKPGGRLVVNEPQAENPFLGFLRGIRKRIDPAYSAHQVEFHPWALRAGFERAGLADVRAVPQGILSTPFAEVPMKPSWLFVPAVALSCFLDRLAERVLGSLLLRITWNVIVYGRRLPEASQAADTGSAMREPCPSEQREVPACARRPARTNRPLWPVPIVLQHGTSPALS